MRVTEKEAAGKLCLLPNDDKWTCGASGCMAWRWAVPRHYAHYRTVRWDDWNPDEDYPDEFEPPRPKNVPADWHFVLDMEEGPYWREPDATRDQRQENFDAARTGYCGLAGAGRAA